MEKLILDEASFTMDDLLRSPEFWLENMRTDLYNAVQDYMDENDLNRSQLAEKLGVTRGYVSQVLNGNSNHSMQKLIELSLSIGKAPYLYLKDLKNVIDDHANKKSIYLNFEEMEDKASRCDKYEFSEIVIDQDSDSQWQSWEICENFSQAQLDIEENLKAPLRSENDLNDNNIIISNEHHGCAA